MRNNYEQPNTGAVSVGELANDARNASNQINDPSCKAICDTIGDFLMEAGTEGPIEAIGDLLNHFFTATDECSLDETPTPLYRMYDGTNYVADMVYRSVSMIKFIVKINDAYEALPKNN